MATSFVTKNTSAEMEAPTEAGATSIDLRDILTIMASRWRLLIATPLVAGALAFSVTHLIAPTFTAKTVFLPPQQQQSAAASALASLGALSGLAGGAAGIKTPGDQYVALMQSVNVQDRIIDKFGLMAVYKSEYRFLARRTLTENTRITLGKKDGLITVEADAESPQLAADLANQHVTELRRLSAELALTDAQQRRAFFEVELKRTRTKLMEAQKVLQTSGFNAGALRAEPKAAAEGYARVKADATAAEVRLQAMRRSLADSSPDVQQQMALLSALHSQLAKLEASTGTQKDADYVSKYREFKYQENLFDVFAKQYEVARMDESRDGALIQIIDVATPPEYKSKPKRAVLSATVAILVFILLLISLVAKHALTGSSFPKTSRAT